MKNLYLILMCFCGTFTIANAQTGIPVPQMSACDTEVQNFMSTFDIPSVTFALAKDGELKYMRAFGNADISGSEPSQPYHMFRIASVSKPITAIGIMKMVEDGTINLNDKIFGPGGLLENHWYFSSSTILDNRVYDITVQHLLEHAAGWDRNQNCFPDPTSPYPWFFSGCDPIVAPLHITQSQGEQNPVKEEFLINYVLEKSLNFTPNSAYSYSNMGYLVLSEIIEEVSGLSYEKWMQQEIFHPLGIYDMHIGKNLQADKYEREGEYVGNGFTTLDLYGSGATVPWEYGGFSIEAMDGHGGWIATSRDLVRLLVAVDGFTTKPDILTPATIASMTAPSANAPFYAKGWSVNPSNNWWHTGAVDGTASIFVRSNDGYTWAIICNKRIADSNANAFWQAIDGMGWNCINSTASFPTFDLFEAPTVNASNLIATGDQVSTMDMSWSNGNGTSRIAVIKDITNLSGPYNFSAYPLDGVDYSANAQFGQGDDLGDGSYVVYNGTGTQVMVTGLDPAKRYAMRVYEYTKNAVNGNNALYLLGDPAQRQGTLSTIDLTLDRLVMVYPTYTDAQLIIEMSQMFEADYRVFDLQGRQLMQGRLVSPTTNLEVQALSSGTYFIVIQGSGQRASYQFVKK